MTQELKFETISIRPERGATGEDVQSLLRDISGVIPAQVVLLRHLRRLEPFSVRVTAAVAETLRCRLENRYCQFHENVTANPPVYSD